MPFDDALTALNSALLAEFGETVTYTKGITSVNVQAIASGPPQADPSSPPFGISLELRESDLPFSAENDDQVLFRSGTYTVINVQRPPLTELLRVSLDKQR